MSGEHWHILGAGAMGGLYAIGLQDSGCPVSLIVRNGGAIERSLTLEDNQGQRRINFPTSSAGQASPIKHLLVTTKAYDVLPAVTAIAHRLRADSQVLLMSNGMGFVDEVLQRFPWLQPYSGTSTEGAFRRSPDWICHSGKGITRIGRPGQRAAPAWLHHWTMATTDCSWEPEIAKALWEKLAINCAINPLTAIHQCRNGELGSRSELALEVDRICDEIHRVVVAAGQAAAVTSLRQRVAQVIRATAANQSSMLQDRIRGSKTEIEYINGYLQKVAEGLNIATPLNQSLVEQVRQFSA